MLTQQQNPTIDSLSERILPILRRHGVLKAALFGSVARGEENQTSDVDLLLEYPEGTTLLDVARIQLQLEEELGRPVDLVSPKYLHDRIKERVLNEQIQIL